MWNEKIGFFFDWKQQNDLLTKALLLSIKAVIAEWPLSTKKDRKIKVDIAFFRGHINIGSYNGERLP
jgi:hypothetical protein